MTSVLHRTSHYEWDTRHVLGFGSTGTVYKGVHGKTGESVAVKTFNCIGHERPFHIQKREMEMLKKVNHENIVKLLAIEKDIVEDRQVIIMELCTGGSLLNILDNPENSCGLPQTELLLVLKDLCAGIKHLRDNKLVHRDLKPGNIMKFISEDGQTIYKLTDFGAARELEDNQPFASLYGTEEYLHPEIYASAFIKNSTKRSFTANIDLWSIGVTLYHVATGTLPFQPINGRKNRPTMYKITTQKPSGAISGKQRIENSQIEWSKTLPSHCHLSEGLKTLITPLLAGLLENKKERAWSFDRFFQEVALILSKRIIHVFFINRTSSIEVFLEPDERIEHFKDRVLSQTNVPLEKQIYLHNSELLEKRVTSCMIAKQFPETTTESPIFLYTNDDNNIQLPVQLDMPKFPKLSANFAADCSTLANSSSRVAYECKRRVNSFICLDLLMKKSVKEFNEAFKAKISLLRDATEYTYHLLTLLIEYRDVVIDCATMIKNSQDKRSIDSALKVVKHDFDRTAEEIMEIRQKCVVGDHLSQRCQLTLFGRPTPSSIRASAIGKHLVESLRESWKHVLNDGASCNNRPFHAFDKVKIDHVHKRLNALLENVQSLTVQMAVGLMEWYKDAQHFYIATQILEQKVNDIESKCDKLRDEFKLQWKSLKDSRIARQEEKNTLLATVKQDQNDMKEKLNESADIITKLLMRK